MSKLMSEGLALVGIINPDAAPVGTYTTAWIDLAKTPALLAIVMAGGLGTNATVNAKFEQATSAAGAGVKDITGKAITQLTQAGTDRSNRQAQINLRGEEVDRNAGYSFVRLSMTVATAASEIGAVVVGGSARYAPADPVASVIETIK